MLPSMVETGWCGDTAQLIQFPEVLPDNGQNAHSYPERVKQGVAEAISKVHPNELDLPSNIGAKCLSSNDYVEQCTREYLQGIAPRVANLKQSTSNTKIEVKTSTKAQVQAILQSPGSNRNGTFKHSRKRKANIHRQKGPKKIERTKDEAGKMIKAIKEKRMEDFRSCIHRLKTASDLSEERWDVVLARTKSLKHDSFRNVPIEELAALLEIVQRKFRVAAYSLIKVPLEKKEIDEVGSMLDCVQIALYIISSPETPRRLADATALERLVKTIVNFFSKNIVSLYATKRTSYGKGSKTTEIKKHWKEIEGAIHRRLMSKALGISKLLKPLVEKRVLLTNELDSLMRVSRSLLKLQSSKVASIQVATVVLVTTICAAHPKRREDVLKILVDVWREISKQDRGKILKSFPLRSQEGSKIQISTALLLSAIQSMALDLSKQCDNIFEIQQDGIPSKVDKEEIRQQLRSIQSGTRTICQSFVLSLVRNISDNLTKCTGQSKNVLMTILEDLLLVLNHPEWPCAEHLILAFAAFFVKSLIQKNAMQQVALDALGEICTKVKRDGVAVTRAKIMPDEKVHYDKNANPTSKEEDASCICDGGKQLPESRRNGVMLDCDICHRWFHTYCMGIRDSQVVPGMKDEERIESWLCDACQIRSEAKKQFMRCRGQSGDQEKSSLDNIEMEEVLQQLQVIYLTKHSKDDILARSARQFTISKWLCTYDETKEDALENSEELDLELEPDMNNNESSPRELKMVEFVVDQWSMPTDQGNDIVLSRDSVIRCTRQYQQTGRLAKQCDKLLYSILKLMSDKAPKNRERVLKAIGKITEVDPRILRLKFVQEVMKFSVKDQAKSVRSAAIDLIGKCMSKMPELSSGYFEVLLDRFRDTGPSVRKKVIKILRSMSSDGLISEKQRVDICINIAEGVFDDQESMQKEVLGIFYELWFLKQDTPNWENSTIDLIIKVAGSPKTSPELLTEILQRIVREAKGAAQKCSDICSLVQQRLLELKEANPNFLTILASYVKTFKLFCDVDSKFLGGHAKYLQPYLNSLLADVPKVPSSAKGKLRSTVITLILDVLAKTIPSLQPPYTKLFKALADNLKQFVIRGNMAVLRAAIPCFCMIVEKENSYEKILRNMFKVFVGVLSKHQNFLRSKAKLDSQKKKLAVRSMYSLALLIKHYDFKTPQEDKKVFNMLLNFCKGSDEILRRFALQGLFHIFSRQTEFMNAAHKVLAGALDSNGPEIIQVTVLRGFAEFLQGEDDLVNSLQREESNPMDEENEEEIPKKQDSSGDSVIPTILQNHLKKILKLVSSSNPAVRLETIRVIFVSLRMGLINPFQCIPSTICFLTDTDQSVYNDAVKMLTFFNEKRPRELRNKAIHGLEECFGFQRSINLQFDPFSRKHVRQDYHKGLSRLYAMISAGKDDRDRFLKGIIQKIKLTLQFLDKSKSERKTAAFVDIPSKVAFYACIVANLPFDYDEPLLVVYHINKILGTEGAQLYETVNDTAASSTPNADSKGQNGREKTALQVTIFSILLKLSQYMKEAYQLNDAKCESWTPYLSNKNSMQKCGRKIEDINFSLADIPGDEDGLQKKISCFLRAMETDSVKLKAAYKRQTRRRTTKKKRKAYVEEKEGMESDVGWTNDGDEDWVPDQARRTVKRKGSKRSLH